MNTDKPKCDKFSLFERMRLIHLKVKIKSLVAESKIIKQESKKFSGEIKWGLDEHNKNVVRKHSRINLLAYGLLKGIPYKAMERNCHTPPDFKKVAEMAKRFGGDQEQIVAWLEEAGFTSPWK